MASASLMPLTAEAVKYNRKLYKISDTQLAMGTFVSMTLIHASRDEAQQAMGMAFEEIRRLTDLLNRFDESTAVGQLNREGMIRDIPREMRYVVSKGLEYHRMSQGNFDITVKPVVDLFYNRGKSLAGHTPTEKEIDRILPLIGSEKIAVNGANIRFKQPGMGITLDGIAKGYIVDEAARVLKDRRVANFLINAGGDIRTSGAKQGEKPWTVAVQDPGKKGKYPDIIPMKDGAIATSGNYEVYFDKEKMLHHIIDPRTGISPLSHASVSVTARTTMDADALSTSVFVMHPDQGVRFINTMPGCECLTITRRGSEHRSAGWHRKIVS
jgi:thiamine biosynthesis lipoprotein